MIESGLKIEGRRVTEKKNKIEEYALSYALILF